MASKLAKVLARIAVIRTIDPAVAKFYQAAYDLTVKARPASTSAAMNALLKSAEIMRATGQGSVANALEHEAEKLGTVRPMTTAELSKAITDLGMDLYRVLTQGLTKVALGSMIWQAEKKLGLHAEESEDEPEEAQA